MRSAMAAALVVLAVSSGCETEVHPARPPARPLRLDPTSLPPSIDYTDADSLVIGGRRFRVDASVNSPLDGWRAPLAVPDGDGSVVFNTWTAGPRGWPPDQDVSIPTGEVGGTPVLRSLQAATGAVTTFAAGAHSVAIRARRAAFARGVDPSYRHNVPYLADVVVRDLGSGEEVVWSFAPDRFTVVAWAGDRLIVYRGIEGGSELQVFDGPRSPRALGGSLSFIALAPDGRTILVDGDAESFDPVVRVVDVATGASIQSIRVGEHLTSGDWVGDTAVASANHGFVVLRTSPGLEVLWVAMFDEKTVPHGLYEPRLTNAGEVVSWTNLNGNHFDSRFVSCRLSDEVCLLGKTLTLPHPVFNPSRP